MKEGKYVGVTSSPEKMGAARGEVSVKEPVCERLVLGVLKGDPGAREGAVVARVVVRGVDGDASVEMGLLTASGGLALTARLSLRPLCSVCALRVTWSRAASALAFDGTPISAVLEACLNNSWFGIIIFPLPTRFPDEN